MKQTQNQRNKKLDSKPRRKEKSSKKTAAVGTGINEDLVAHKEMKVGSDDPIGEQLDLVEDGSSVENTPVMNVRHNPY